MKFTKRKLLPVSFMLFSLFFGAGNLIFPPFLGQNAGSQTPLALLGFLITAVVLPVMGVVAVAEFDGLDHLAQKVGMKFSIVFTVLIYLSIGPGLAIPRAASVPFEMAIAPYLPQEASPKLFMLLYSLGFFLLAGGMALSPSKLLDSIGKVLTPILLVLLAILFGGFLFGGTRQVAPPQPAYASGALVTGFLEGYNTMDAIAALNFGLVIATTLRALQVEQKKDVMKYTIQSGVLAGVLLSLIYALLCYMGMESSGVYALQDNGAWTLRCIVHQIFGELGAVLLAAIFTLACLTTCVGLINSVAQYFSSLLPRFTYRQLVFVVTVFSFLVCNQGLTTILSISVPVLNMVYPVAIVLIILGLCHKWLAGNTLVFPLTIGAVSVVSIVYALASMGLSLGFVSRLFGWLPFFSYGMGWVSVAVAAVIISLLLGGQRHTKEAAAKG